MLFLFQYLSAQDTGEQLHAERHKYDPNYRVNYFNKMIVKFDINSDVDSYTIPNLNHSENTKSKFIPNQSAKLRLSFDYKFLGLFISYSPNFTAGNKSKYGETKTLDLSFKYFYNDRLRQEVDYKIIKGFYLNNPNESIPIDIFPNLEIKTIGGKTLYVTNNNFSYRAYENMTERQIQNAGSFIPSFGYYFNTLKSKRTSTSEKYLIKAHTIDAIFQFGYMYNFVLSRKWFATLGAHPGLGFNNSKSFYYNPINNRNTSILSNTFNLNIDANISLGYNAKDLFTGIKANFREYQYDNSKTAELINSKIYFNVFVGYRFNEIKSVKKVFEKLEKKIF